MVGTANAKEGPDDAAVEDFVCVLKPLAPNADPSADRH
jgi:hypothetical protein